MSSAKRKKGYTLRKTTGGYVLNCQGKLAFLYYYPPERSWYGHPCDADLHSTGEADFAYRKEELIEAMCERLQGEPARRNPKRLDYGKYAGEANGLPFIVKQVGSYWGVYFYSPRMVAEAGLEYGVPFYEADDYFRTKRDAVAAAVDLATDPAYGLIKRAASSDSYYFDYPEGRETLAHIVEAAKRYMHQNPSPRTFIPPKAVADQARMGLALRNSLPPSQRCCTSVGLRRAVQLATRQPVSVSTLKRMRSYFQRHAVDARGIGWHETSKGWQAWLCWGSDAGREWCNEILDRLEE